MNQQFFWLKTKLLPLKLSKTCAYYIQSAALTDFRNKSDRRKKPQLNAYERLDSIENGIIRRAIAEIKINGKQDRDWQNNSGPGHQTSKPKTAKRYLETLAG